MLGDSGKIDGVLGKGYSVIITTISIEIDLARELYERLLSKGWRRTKLFEKKAKYRSKYILWSTFLANLSLCKTVSNKKESHKNLLYNWVFTKNVDSIKTTT